MVSFRMSEEEYERLWSACAETGARSVSDLARTAVGLMIGPAAAEPAERQLEGRVRDLENLVHELWLRFGRSGARVPEAASGNAPREMAPGPGRGGQSG